MKIDLSQAQTANDVCKCRGCGAKMQVTIVPDLKVNKWICRNCSLTQLWIPSKEYRESPLVPEGGTKKLGVQKTLFCSGPFVGIGEDGCLTGVYDNPNNILAIVVSAVLIGLLAIVKEYYRVNQKPLSGDEG